MKKNLLLLFAMLMVAVSASAQVKVCGVWPDENGHFDSPFIKSGTVTWSENNHTLTLDNAVVEYSSDSPYDYIDPIYMTENATIVIHGECRVTSTGFVAIGLNSYNTKYVTIKGNGRLITSSSWIDIFLVATRLTIQDINLNVANGIGNNAEGNDISLTFDNAQATIKGGVYRIGLGITFKDCAITYPADAYIAESEYGATIYAGNDNTPDEIRISRNGISLKGDVNGDGEVTIADVNAVIEVILGHGANGMADVNGDKEVTIADVNVIIDIILHPAAGGGHEWVDLGLPSGTLWATCNVGADSPEQYGDYFAWGETAPKEVYSWETYKWCNGSKKTMTKYCTSSEYGTVDGKTELDSKDDAAYVNWGVSWRMPTKEQCIELSDYCTWTWTELNGVNGQLITGPNGNTMFLPAAGERYNDKVGDLGSFGQFWSRTLYSDADYAANILYLNSNQLSGVFGNDRYMGFSIRPVRVQ